MWVVLVGESACPLSVNCNPNSGVTLPPFYSTAAFSATKSKCKQNSLGLGTTNTLSLFPSLLILLS
uniref:Uncharacterized protein n=1 Tax=Nelumbo nucifera TaxID=4432 RepID=A0A822Y515_NELNU|nr:TPA_asm: hypothetical protein HUJ06_028159 [Nelumbo nucifera]